MIEAGNIAAILLAAGRSQRFGSADKLLAPLDGEPLIVHAAQRLVELAPARLIAVCGGAEDTSAKLLAALGFEIVGNPQPELGLSRSLALGIAKAANGSADAALISLADMPFVSLAHLRRLLDVFDEIAAPMVASRRDGVAMPPALFARPLFDPLKLGRGDKGGRAFLGGARLVDAAAGELDDIDLPGDLG